MIDLAILMEHMAIGDILMHWCLRPKRMLHHINTSLIVDNVTLQHHCKQANAIIIVKGEISSLLAYMMTSSKGNISALLAICAGNSPVTVEFPAKRPVTRSIDVFFDLCLNNSRVNNREAGNLRHHRAHYDVTEFRFGLKYNWTCALCHLVYTRPQ